MKKFILLFLGCAQICFGMFPKPKVAHHKPLIATQQPKFKIEYLALKQSFFVVKDSAFSYMGEINQGLDFGPMHYFEAKMRMLQVNGSEYLRSIKTHIQDKITELGDKNTQKPIMLKHIGFIDQILSEPDIQRIDSYQVIKKLLRDGKIDQAVSAISIYRSKYGDAGSVIALESMIDSIQRQPKSTGGAVEALVASVGVGLSMDMRVGELPSSLNIIKCSEFHPIDLEKWRQAYLVSGGGGKDFSTNSSKLSVQVVVRSCTIKKQTHSIKNVPELTNRQTLNAEIKQQCLEWQKNGEKSSIKSQIELLEKVTFGREHKKCQCKQKHNELLESLRAILDENKTDDFHIIQTGSECEAQKVLAKYEDQFLRQVQGVPIQSTGSSTSFGFSQEYYDFQQARKLFAKRFGSADGVRTQPAAATVQNCDLVSTSAPLISDVSLNDIFKNKPKLYNLDTAQDFKSIGDAVLEHCDFVLTGLSDQSGDNIQAIKQEFALEIQSAQKAESLEEFSYHLSVADLRLEMAKHILEYKELHPEFANELLEKIDRSAELLGRAITSFAQRTQDNVTHPEREVYNRVMAPIHLARLGYSVSKMASQYGYALISSESQWQFVCNTWSSLCGMCSHTTADDFFDSLGVLAAEVMTQRGLSKVCRYLSKLELAAETVGKGKDLLQKIENGFDRVLKKSPMPIPVHAKIPAAEIIRDLKERGITVPGLRQNSIKEVRALKELPLYYILRRTYRDIRKYEHLYENKFKGFGPFANQYIKFPWKHIFAPDFQKVRDNYLARFNGWHHDYHDIIEKSRLIEFLTKKEIVKSGFSKAKTYWTKPLPIKTFFPSDWTRSKVMNKVAEAYNDFLSKGANFENLESGKYKVVGRISEGIEINMYFSKNGILQTVYPVL